MKSQIHKHHSISIMPVCKQLSIAVIFLLSVIGTRAADKDPEFVGFYNFKHQYPNATVISYKVKGLYTEVNFIWNDMRLQAFYSQEGDFVATCREVVIGSLPLSVQMSLKNEYPNYITRDAIEYDDSDNGVSYFVTMIGQKATYLLRVSTGGTISVFKKMKN